MMVRGFRRSLFFESRRWMSDNCRTAGSLNGNSSQPDCDFPEGIKSLTDLGVQFGPVTKMWGPLFIVSFAASLLQSVGTEPSGIEVCPDIITDATDHLVVVIARCLINIPTVNGSGLDGVVASEIVPGGHREGRSHHAGIDAASHTFADHRIQKRTLPDSAQNGKVFDQENQFSSVCQQLAANLQENLGE